MSKNITIIGNSGVRVDNGWKAHNGVIHSQTYITWDFVPPKHLLKQVYKSVSRYASIPYKVDYQPNK